MFSIFCNQVCRLALFFNSHNSTNQGFRILNFSRDDKISWMFSLLTGLDGRTFPNLTLKSRLLGCKNVLNTLGLPWQIKKPPTEILVLFACVKKIFRWFSLRINLVNRAYFGPFCTLRQLKVVYSGFQLLLVLLDFTSLCDIIVFLFVIVSQEVFL